MVTFSNSFVLASPATGLSKFKRSDLKTDAAGSRGVVLDLTAAKGFAAWLNEQVAELEKRREQILGDQKQTEEFRK